MLAQYTGFSLIMHTNNLEYTMTDQQFVLKWHYHETTLLQNLPYLLENDILSDVTLSVGAQHIKAHKIILAMCSVYFLQLFQELKNTQHPVVVLHNASMEDVRAMLAFMYRGQCVVSEDQLPNLLSIAKLLKIQGLCDMKAPEKRPATETIPLMHARDSRYPIESKLNPSNQAICDKETSEKKICESPSCIPNTISLRRHSGNGGYSTAINLSIDSTTVRLPDSPTWEKPLRVQPDNTSPCSTEDTIPTYPTTAVRKQASPKDSSETCKCFLCGKYLSNQYNLRVHMETHEEAYHACASCPHVSRSRDALRKHVSYRHPEEYLTRKRKKTDSS
ncbi:protein bric-a-brac 2 isoform X1 [Dendroctonus ponderosae]|uniref:protein bric-a-brac 2 isoform X1 n=1 Tax=Dendroctonus ponderosae TaxID=77166 RepID=UPI002034CE24|nr:protein bric-a-brac 2 isoform X1 [Dendroctonus ponderosae]